MRQSRRLQWPWRNPGNQQESGMAYPHIAGAVARAMDPDEIEKVEEERR